MRAVIALVLAAAAAGSAIYAQQAGPASPVGGAAPSQFAGFVPVTSQMLLTPPADDWLMFSRTYDAQRHSPLRQITRGNVGQLREVCVIPGDTIVASNYNNPRVSVFDRTGAHVRTFTPEGRVPDGGCLADGTLLLEVRQPRGSGSFSR